MFEETNWLRENSSKLCPLLRKKVIESYRLPGYTPCFLHRPVRDLRKRYGRIPVNVTTLKKIIAHEGIRGIWYDREIKALLDVAAPVVNVPPVWGSGFNLTWWPRESALSPRGRPTPTWIKTTKTPWSESGIRPSPAPLWPLRSVPGLSP